MPLADGLTYDCVGATEPAEARWRAHPAGFLRHESSVVLGRGVKVWDEAVSQLMDWRVKTASGFVVQPQGPATEGADYRVTFPLGPLRVVEPVRVVVVVDAHDRVGFAYGTAAGHPVAGEEAFVVTRDAEGVVRLVLRSLTRPSTHAGWALAFPVLLLVQLLVRRRYRRFLRPAERKVSRRAHR